MAEQRTMKSIYDFIYIDTNKIHSYYAQLTDGLPNQKKVSNKEGMVRSARGVIGSTQVALGEGSGSSAREESLEEMMDMAHVLPRDMINLLDAHKLIARKLGANNLGRLVLVKGLLHMFDAHSFNKLSGPILTITKRNLGEEAFKEALGDFDDVMMGAVKELLSSYPARIQANIQVEGEKITSYAWMSLDEALFTSGYIDFSLKHNQASIEDFHVLGILDSLPSQFEDEQVKIKREKLVNKVTSSMPLGLFGSEASQKTKVFMGRPEDFYGITPVCIFRKIDIPES